MTGRTGKWLRAVCGGVTVALAIAGCSSAGGSGSGTAAGTTALTMPGPSGPLETKTITIEAVPTADEAGLYIAKDLGYFKQQGLTVTIVPTGGGELALADLGSGKTNLVAGNYVSFVLAQMNHDYNLRIIAGGSQMQPGNQALYVMPNSKIRSVADLATQHANISVNTLSNIGTLLIGSLMTDNGYKLQDVNLVAPSAAETAAAGNPFAADISLLAQGKVQAAWLPEPFATIAQQTLGAIKIADFDSGSLKNFPIGGYFGTTSWVQSHPNTIAAFLRALQEGQQKADTDRTQVESSLVSNTLVPNKTPLAQAQQIAALMTIDNYPLTMTVPELQRVSNSMFQFGLESHLTQPYSISNMIQAEPGMTR
jgi:NitT/TauT family transport system substrate-binding protein